MKLLYLLMFFLFVFFSVLSGCSDSGTVITPTAIVATQTPAPTSVKTITPTPVHQTINPTGGTVTYGKASIKFDAGSVNYDVDINESIEADDYIPSISTDGYLYDFSLEDPNAYNPDHRATITLPLEDVPDPDIDGLTIYHSKDKINWESLGGTVNGEYITAEVPGFSYFTVGEAPIKNPQVDAKIASFVTTTSPGASVIVISNGKIVHRAGYGVKDISNNNAITSETIFHLGSMAKQITAVGVLMLVDEGKVKLDEPIGTYLPGLSRFGTNVTVRRMLNHTSGMPDYSESGTLYDQFADAYSKPYNQDALNFLSVNGTMKFTPGEKHAYNNTGYDMLGCLIEKVSGLPFQTFMQQRIFNPLKMSNSFAHPNPGRLSAPNLAHSYERRDGQITAYDSSRMDYLGGSGGVYSTIEDMYLYDQALYTDKLVKQTTLAEAFKPALLNNGTLYPYGFGWDIGTRNGKNYVKHDGRWLAFNSNYVRFPDQKLSVIILLNRDYDIPDLSDLGMSIADLYL